MSDSLILTLADLVAGALDLRVWCLCCARGNCTDPAPVLAQFRKRSWPPDLISARRHFRCPYCRQKAWMLLIPSRRPRLMPEPELQFSPEQLTQKAMGEAIWFFLRSVGKAKNATPLAPGVPRLIEPQPRVTPQSLAKAEARAQRIRAAWRVIVRPPPRAERLTQALAALEDRPMCNRYQLRDSHAEIAQLALQMVPERGLNYAAEVYPGYPGLVIAEGRARVMHWGFPLVLKGKQGQPLKPKPVNNAREDKLQGPFWRDSFAKRRCLIPATAWAEAEGEKGRMTCTWHSLGEDGPFMLGGVWRPTEEWGDAYSMVMVDGSPQMAEVHDRMPVILAPEHWRLWTDGAPADAFALCQTWIGELKIERTASLWAARD